MQRSYEPFWILYHFQLFIKNIQNKTQTEQNMKTKTLPDSLRVHTWVYIPQEVATVLDIDGKECKND